MTMPLFRAIVARLDKFIQLSSTKMPPCNGNHWIPTKTHGTMPLTTVRHAAILALGIQEKDEHGAIKGNHFTAEMDATNQNKGRSKKAISLCSAKEIHQRNRVALCRHLPRVRNHKRAGYTRDSQRQRGGGQLTTATQNALDPPGPGQSIMAGRPTISQGKAYRLSQGIAVAFNRLIQSYTRNQP